jgi:sortase (surface protein transpeptidase)
MKKKIIPGLIILMLITVFHPMEISGNSLLEMEMTLHNEKMQNAHKKKEHLKNKSDKDQHKARHLRKLKRKIKDCGCN